MEPGLCGETCWAVFAVAATTRSTTSLLGFRFGAFLELISFGPDDERQAGALYVPATGFALRP